METFCFYILAAGKVNQLLLLNFLAVLIKLSSNVILLFTVHSIECTVPEQFSCYISWSKQSTDVLIQPSSALGKQAVWKGWKYKKLSIWKSLCICITKFCCSIKWKNLPKKCQQMSSIHPASNSCTHTRLTALFRDYHPGEPVPER